MKYNYVYIKCKTWLSMSINLPKCTDLDYINFLIAASNVYSCTEAARCFPSTTDAPCHDCFTRLLQKQPSDFGISSYRFSQALIARYEVT